MLATRILPLLLAIIPGSAWAQPATSDRGLEAAAESDAGDGAYRTFAEIERAAAATKPPAPVIKLPELDDWTRSEARSLPPEDHGFMMAYNHQQGVTVTFYQFTRGLRDIPNDLQSESIQNEMKRARAGINQAVQAGFWQSAKESDSGIVRLGESKKPALWSRHLLIFDGDEVTSDTYVWSHKNTFFKTRCTFGGRYADAATEAKVLSELLTALGNASLSNAER